MSHENYQLRGKKRPNDELQLRKESSSVSMKTLKRSRKQKRLQMPSIQALDIEREHWNWKRYHSGHHTRSIHLVTRPLESELQLINTWANTNTRECRLIFLVNTRHYVYAKSNMLFYIWVKWQKRAVNIDKEDMMKHRELVSQIRKN